MADEPRRRRSDLDASMPEWRDFRQPNPGEDQWAYFMAKTDFNDLQHRRREHWLVNQQNAILGHQELLKLELMGDGSPLRPGILNHIASQQSEVKAMIRHGITDAAEKARAAEYDRLRRWVGGIVAGVVVAVLAAAIIAISLQK